MRIPFLPGAYEGISTNLSPQEAINWFYQPPEKREDHQGAMVPVHGATLFDTLANTGDIRGMLYDPNGSLLYVVSDNDLYSVTSAGTETARDVLATTSGRVEMALNPAGQEIVTVDGTTGLHYAIATTTGTDISDTDFPDTATTVAHINGRFLVNDPTTPGVFWWSDINDGTAWGATSFSTAQSIASPIRRIVVDKGDVYLLGDLRSEVWYNSTDPDLIFERVEEIESGIAAAFSACRFDNTVAWLAISERGGLQAVRSGNGYQPQVFSTPALTRKWEQYATVSDAFAYVMSIDGHEFYILTFPTAGATWAFDALTQEWHQRSSAFSSGSPTREKANCHAYCSGWSGGTHILGDFNETGKLFAVSTSVYTFDSANMERRLTTPLIAEPNEKNLRFSQIQVDLEEGVIDASDTGDDRQVLLQWANDGGHTYNTGVSLNIGEAAVDGYTHRAVVRKLGRARLWNFRLYTDTKRKIIVKGAMGRLPGESVSGIAA